MTTRQNTVLWHDKPVQHVYQSSLSNNGNGVNSPMLLSPATASVMPATTTVASATGNTPLRPGRLHTPVTPATGALPTVINNSTGSDGGGRGEQQHFARSFSFEDAARMSIPEESGTFSTSAATPAVAAATGGHRGDATSPSAHTPASSAPLPPDPYRTLSSHYLHPGSLLHAEPLPSPSSLNPFLHAHASSFRVSLESVVVLSGWDAPTRVVTATREWITALNQLEIVGVASEWAGEATVAATAAAQAAQQAAQMAA